MRPGGCISLCYGEQASFCLSCRLPRERGGYVLTNVDNLSAGYSFAESRRCLIECPPQQQRIDLLKPLINAKSCEDPQFPQSSGAVPSYADQSLLFARVSQLSCLEQFKDTDVERLWLKETSGPSIWACLVGCLLSIHPKALAGRGAFPGIGL